MCDGPSLAVASLTLSAIGTASSIFGQLQQGKAASAQARFQAQVARNNQILAQRKADDARARGKIASGESDLRKKQLIGKQRVVFASTGQEVDTGSALDITSDTAALGKLDSLRIINNAEREAAGFEALGSNFASEATLRDAAGQNALSASRIGSFGSLATGLGSVAQKWYGFKQDKTF